MGVNVNAQNFSDDGWAALHYAAHEGLDHLVEHLIRKLDANVDLQTSNGRTALHIACTQQHRAVIERLLLAGANANIKTRADGNTPLHILSRYCTSSSNQDLITLILPFSQESLTIKNRNGYTPAELSPLIAVQEMLSKKQAEKQRTSLMGEKAGDLIRDDNASTVKNSGV